MVRTPPTFVVTTPESLYLLVTAERSRATLRQRRDGDRRRDPRPGPRQAGRAPGAHPRTPRPRVRATRRCGSGCRPRRSRSRSWPGCSSVPAPGRAGRARCAIVDTGHQRDLDLALELPGGELEAMISAAQMDSVLERIAELVAEHRDHARVRQHPQAGRAARPPARRTPGRGRRRSPPREPSRRSAANGSSPDCAPGS